MCTSFACYIDRPLYAMNFDCWEVPMRMRLSEDGVFWFEANMMGQYLETAAMNDKGFFGNFQGNLSARHKNVEPGPGTIGIDQVFRESLKTSESIADLRAVIGDKTVVYPPVPPEWNLLHNLFADRSGGSLVLETADCHNDITDISGNYMVMTNFPLGETKNRPLGEISGAGEDRFKLACEHLNSCNNFDVTAAFDLLQKAVQVTDQWKTLCSMVFDPVELQIHCVLDRQFGNIFTVNIKDGIITGDSSSQLNLTFKGLT